MWLKIVRGIYAVAVATGLDTKIKDWFKARLQAAVEKGRQKVQEAVDAADKHQVQGVYGVKINRKRAPKPVSKPRKPRAKKTAPVAEPPVPVAAPAEPEVKG